MNSAEQINAAVNKVNTIGDLSVAIQRFKVE